MKTPPYRPRTWIFLGVTAVLSLFFLGWRNPSPSAAYAGLVRAVAAAITRDPATVGGYMARLRPATEFFAVAYLTGIALTARASLSRRAAMLFHAVLYVALSALGQALLIVAGMTTRWLIGPFGVEATLVNLLLAGLVVTQAHVHDVRAASRDHLAGRPSPLDSGHAAGLLLAHCRGRFPGHRLRLPGRAGQCDVSVAGVRPALCGEHPVRAAGRPAVAAVVDRPEAAAAGPRPARRRRDHPGVQRGRQHCQAAALHRRGRRSLWRAGARPGFRRRLHRRHRADRMGRARSLPARPRRGL